MTPWTVRPARTPAVPRMTNGVDDSGWDGRHTVPCYWYQQEGGARHALRVCLLEAVGANFRLINDPEELRRGYSEFWSIGTQSAFILPVSRNQLTPP